MGSTIPVREAQGGYDPGVRSCWTVWHKAYPEIPKGNMNDDIEEQGPIQGWCQEIRLFAQAAKAAGRNLNSARPSSPPCRRSRTFPGGYSPLLTYGPTKLYGPTQYQVVRLHVNSPPSSQCRIPLGNLPPQVVCWTPVQPWKPLPTRRERTWRARPRPNRPHPSRPDRSPSGCTRTTSLPADEIVSEFCAQAGLALGSGFDGIMTSEHHGGFAGYMAQPLQMASFVLAEQATGWAAAAPLLLPLRSTALLAEEVAWLQARHGGRVGLGVAAGALPLDFEVAGVSQADSVDRFKSELPRIVALLRGAGTGGPRR